MNQGQTVLIDSGQWSEFQSYVTAFNLQLTALITVGTALFIATLAVLFFQIIAATRRSR